MRIAGVLLICSFILTTTGCQNMREINRRDASTLAGGVAGGVLVGSLTGNTAATVAGTLGGAYAGNQLSR